MDKQALADFIRGSISVTDHTLTTILAQYEPRVLRRNEYLLHEGETSNDYLFLEAGILRAFTLDPDGREVTTFFYAPHQVVFEVSSFFLRSASGESIQALTPQAQARWGKMRVDQMLRHLSELVETANGTRTQPGNWLTAVLTVVVGKLLKNRLINSDKLLPRNLGRAPLPASDGFAREQQRLTAMLEQFELRNLSTRPLPVFGRLSATDWDQFLVKQLEHHLTQFGG